MSARRRPGAGRAGARAANTARQPTEIDVLLAALQEQELRATHELEIVHAPARGRRGVAARAGGTAAMDVDVAVGPNESAAVLVEQDGELSWHFPEPVAEPKRRPAARGVKRASAKTSDGSRSLTITVKLPARARVAGAARPGRRGIGVGSIKAAKGIVLKFIARTTAGVTMKFLERNVRKGIIVMDGDDATQWRRVERLEDLTLPDGPLRVLLWVHGTFSSTAGAFGAMTSTPEGRAFLSEARGRYHVVIGYDHPTLSEDPLENAVDLVERLGRFKRPMQIDAIMHSRGGLVYRSLVEHLLPASDDKPQLGPAVFVGVPNNGTLLAEPENWHALLDLYTNLAVGAFRLLQTVPGATPAARVLAELVSGLGAFVKYLADVIVTERRVPGLAAQEPKGEFMQRLNAVGAGQPLPEGSRYLAVTSNFDPKAALATGKPTGLAASLVGKLANGFVDKLFRETNDLVVNDASMKQIDAEAGNFMDGALDFGDSPTVYHTVYFAQPQVAQNLRVWLIDESARRGIAERPGAFTVFPSARSPFTRVRYHHGNAPAHRRRDGETPSEKKTTRARRGAKGPSAGALSRSAAVEIDSLLGERHEAPPRPAARTAGAPSAPRNYAPKLVETTKQVSRLSTSKSVHLVSFAQTYKSIPIFGTRAVIELDDRRDLVAAYAKLARVDKVSADATLSVKEALDKLSRSVAMSADTRGRLVATNPPLTFFHDRAADQWHLAYVFADVPGAPATRKGVKGRNGKSKKPARDWHGIGGSPRMRMQRLDYLVDAHDGSLVYYYSVTPTAAKPPINVRGTDDEGVLQTFFGSAAKFGFVLEDSLRFIRTHDLGGGDIDSAKVPTKPIGASTFNFGTTNTAGVSAHVNAMHVFDFYNSVLIRRGIDDNHMRLVNVVNTTSAADEEPPEWGNAVWWNKKMWYGQVKNGAKGFKSFARYLDIIAHELTHGVTETTCNLVYRDEAGALNESFSDIFGVIIANSVKKKGADTRDWDWNIGAGLGEKAGMPLRNMANPKLTKDPAHVKDMLVLEPGESATYDNDYGYVHTNSNIHNKAAFNLLTATGGGAKRRGKAKGRGRGKRTALVFQPNEVAKLYYFTLQRLDRVATFEDVYFTLIDVTRTMYPDPADQKDRLAAVTAAYGAVGIPRQNTVPPAGRKAGSIG